MLLIINYKLGLPTCLHHIVAYFYVKITAYTQQHQQLGRVPARAALHRGCVVVSVSDSYALLFLVHNSRHAHKFLSVTVVSV